MFNQFGNPIILGPLYQFSSFGPKIGLISVHAVKFYISSTAIRLISVEVLAFYAK